MRGTGTTTQQMKAAAHGALYVWNNTPGVDWCRKKAKFAGREDLQVVPVAVLDDSSYIHPTEYSEVIIDHAVEDIGNRHANVARLMRMATNIVKINPNIDGVIELHDRFAKEFK